MKFPILIIKDNESPIYYFDSGSFGLVSKGGEPIYKKGTIYDSEGNKFLIFGIESVKRSPILKSLIYFQPMKEVSVKYSATGKVTLSEFQQIAIDHIQLFKKYWAKRDLIESLKKAIMHKNSFF